MKGLLPLLLVAASFSAFSQSVEKTISLPYTASTAPTRPSLIYYPDDYNLTTTRYPLLVFLHEWTQSGTNLSLIYNSNTSGGPAYLIEHGGWPSSFTNPKDGNAYKFIVVSPQSNNGWSSSGDETEYMIKYLVANYRVDTNRIYLMGLAAGGAGVTEYAAHLNSDENSMTSTRTYKAAAIVPLSMSTNRPSTAWSNRIVADSIQSWGHGDPNHDVYGEFTMDLELYANQAKAGYGLFTPNNYGHGGWSNIYIPTFRQIINGTAMNIYEWMLTNTRAIPPPGPPIANAGNNQTITLPTNSATLSGTATASGGTTITGYAWTELSGPNTATIASPSSAVTRDSGLIQGTYVFQLKVTQSDGQTGTASVSVTVNPTPPPTANAGSNQTITLPTNSGTLTGSGTAASGTTITAYAWTETSGPNTATIASPSSASTGISGLIQGGYVFQLKVTQSDGQTATATVTETVNPVPPPPPPTVSAGSNQTIILPANSLTLTGSATASSGDTITAYAWTELSGPNTATIASPSSAVTGVSGLIKGAYRFQLKVTQSDGQTATATVMDSVNSLPPPTVSAGSNQTITLPTNSLTLTGSATASSGNTITAYAWTELSGPNTATIASPSSAVTGVSGLIQGAYVFQLKVTQSDGQTATATVTETVNPVSSVYASPSAIAGGDQSLTVSTANLTSAYTITGSTLSSILWTKFSVPGQKKMKIGILGSSTAAGWGTTTYDSSFAGRLLKFYKGAGIIDSVVNLAVGGYNPYRAMPTGYVPPYDVYAKLSPSDTPAVNNNITAMLRHKPDVIILSFPTNGYDVLTMDEIMQPLQTIYNICVAQGILCYVTTTQPRTDASFSVTKQKFLQVIRDSIQNRFGANAIDFYDAVTVPGTTQQMPAYYYGDGIHLNDAAHAQLFNLVVGANIFQNLIASSSSIGTPSAQNTTVTNLPNGASKFQVTIRDGHGQAANAFTTLTVSLPAGTPVSLANGTGMMFTDNDKANSFILSPNVVRDMAILTLHNGHTGTMVVQLVDPSGSICRTLRVRKDQSFSQVNLYLSDLPAALYFVRVQIGNWVDTKRLLKL